MLTSESLSSLAVIKVVLFFFYIYYINNKYEYIKKVATSKSGRKASGEAKPTNTLIFQNCENLSFCCFSHPASDLLL